MFPRPQCASRRGWRAGGGGSAVSVVPNKRTRPRRSPASVGLSPEERRDVQVALGEPVVALGAQLPGAPAPRGAARRERRQARRGRPGRPGVPPATSRLTPASGGGGSACSERHSPRTHPRRLAIPVCWHTEDVGTSQLLPHGRPPAYLTFASLTALGLPNATTTRHCPGVASFAEPISAANPVAPFNADAIRTLMVAGLDLTRVSYAKQVHGAEVARAPEGGGFAGTVDILVTVEPHAPLAIFTADCLAIVLYDPEVPALAAAHVGWRGTVRGVAQAAVAALGRLGARPERLYAAIAPSIGPCCYEVDEPVTSELARAYPGRDRKSTR